MLTFSKRRGLYHIAERGFNVEKNNFEALMYWIKIKLQNLSGEILYERGKSKKIYKK